MRDHRKPLLYMLLVSFTSALAVSIGGVVYTGVTTNENNRKWCEFLIPIDEGYRAQSPPPTSEFAKRIGQAAGNLRVQFECEE